MKIDNPTTNCLALTSFVLSKMIHPLACSSMSVWEKQGWSFFFELRGEELHAIMTGVFPHGTETHETVATDEIKHVVLEFNNILPLQA